MTSTAYLLGHITANRTMEPDTIGVLIPFFTDANQFRDPQAVLERTAESGMADPDREEILAGEVSLALTFFEATPVAQLGTCKSLPDIPDRFNDAVNFEVRVPGIAGAVLPYLSRVDAPLSDQTVRGIATIENLRAAPGFSSYDILGAALDLMKVFTAISDSGVLFLHAAQDLHDSATTLHREMADQLRFAKSRPDFKITTFPRIAPLAGTLAGVIPAGGSWAKGTDFIAVPSVYDIDPSWWEEVQGNNLAVPIN